MYEILLVLLSLLLGRGLTRLTRDELAAGKRYFQVICFIVLVSLAAFILLQGISGMLMLGILAGIGIGIGIGFLLQHPYFYFGLLGMMTAWGFPREIFIILVALFTLSFCSLHYGELGWKKIAIAMGFFVLPYGLLLLPSSALFFSFYHPLFYGIIFGGFIHVARRLR